MFFQQYLLQSDSVIESTPPESDRQRHFLASGIFSMYAKWNAPTDVPRGADAFNDRRKTAQNLVDSRKNWKIFTVSRKLGKKG